MQEKTIFLSFDFGIRGDYTGLYTWLDKYKAKECGSGLAVLKVPFKADMFTSLKQELLDSLRLEKTDRLYVLWKDDQTGKLTGRFLYGNRKTAPWEGYATINTPIIDIEE